MNKPGFFMRSLAETYLFLRSLGYGMVVMSWLVIRRIIGFFRRHGMRGRPVKRRRPGQHYYRARSRRYQLHTARLVRHFDRWLG